VRPLLEMSRTAAMGRWSRPGHLMALAGQRGQGAHRGEIWRSAKRGA